MGPRIGPVGEESQMPDKDTKATMGTEDTSGDMASLESQDSRPSVFHNIKFFVLCHSLLQLAQLMISGYLKSSISTVEKRFGLSSQTSGLLAAFNEVGNTALIVFVSYFGSRVHRPRLIGYGAILVALAGLLMALPHFISEPYSYDSTSPVDMPQNSEASLCQPTTLAPAPSNGSSCSSYTETKHLALVAIMFTAQTLLGVGSVPIQPFGISYIDDFAHNNNSPLYLGILFAVTMMGPGMAYGLGGLMLSLYVDINRMPEGGINLTSKDPRWVGAWWLGFLISAGVVALAATPYFFFPREMPKEKQELLFRRRVFAVVSKGEDSSSEQSPEESPKKRDGLAQIAPNLTVIQFIKVFPGVLLRTLRHPIFLLVVLSQVCLSSMAAGMATFLPKFLERQFSVTASYANVLIGCLSFPSAILGIIVGGILVKRLHLGPMHCSVLCLLGALSCLLLSLPLFFMGCPTHQIAGIIHQPGTQQGLELFPGCMEPCSCPMDDFNPVCDASTRVEFLTPCHAGCANRVVQEAPDKSQSLKRKRESGASWLGSAPVGHLRALSVSRPLLQESLARGLPGHLEGGDTIKHTLSWPGAFPGSLERGRLSFILQPFKGSQFSGSLLLRFFTLAGGRAWTHPLATKPPNLRRLHSIAQDSQAKASFRRLLILLRSGLSAQHFLLSASLWVHPGPYVQYLVQYVKLLPGGKLAGHLVRCVSGNSSPGPLSPGHPSAPSSPPCCPLLHSASTGQKGRVVCSL